MHNNDQAMKDYVATLPVPAFENPAFNRPQPLKDARDQRGFEPKRRRGEVDGG
jgi:hypothetical protein